MLGLSFPTHTDHSFHLLLDVDHVQVGGCLGRVCGCGGDEVVTATPAVTAPHWVTRQEGVINLKNESDAKPQQPNTNLFGSQESVTT